ncbi:MAG: hypothetical protein HOP12_01025 [Candidatus Eisenbacteria bacterium]|uniref:Uncharacterized protein n=1 Tax=Eiseniibacteriota bacterium TaxID=2212470 RepID=A0A849SMR7_UNCEI|nr:hypothetical protein [Candidatus Eisenbacteria bacterium]
MVTDGQVRRLMACIQREKSLSVAAVSRIVHSGDPLPQVTAVTIAEVNLSSYDALLVGA